MTNRDSKISPFQYLDYRRFLKDWFETAKKTRASMSYRRFAEKAGLKSSNFLMLVMQGKRDLSEETIPKVAKGLGLGRQEAEFFANLVRYNQAGHHEEKDRHYRLMLRSHRYQRLQPVRVDQYEYCTRWYHAAIREMIAAKGYDGTSEWIASRLAPAVTPSEVEHSIRVLDHLGFIEKTAEGRWRQKEALVSTGAEVESVELFAYHAGMLDLTKQILDAVPGDRRDVSAMTLGVTKKRVPQVKRAIQNFRMEILKLVSEDHNPEEVLQVNIYMFPLTKAPGGKA